MMKKVLMITYLTGIVFACTRSSKTDKAQADLREAAAKAIAESNAIYFNAYVHNDSAVFIERYADDACILAPNAPTMCGREAVARFFRESYNQYGMRNGKFITTAIYGDGKEYVTEEGLWQSFDAAGNLFDDGKFLVLWKKTEKGWKMYRDSFSSNRNN
jgi:ketosteroid isomerase-like protein